MSLKRNILERVSDVPPLPDVMMRLRECCTDPDVDYGRMARIIELDAGLTSSILRLANSSYFGRSGSVSSVQFAMTRLGLQRVHQMALAVCVAPAIGHQVDGYGLDPEALWSHSLATAMAAEMMAGLVPGVEPSDAFTAGLLHDMGKTILGLFVAEQYGEIRGLVRDVGCSFDEAERSVLGTDHSTVAAMLLRDWQLPDHIVEAVRWHHKPSGAGEGGLLVDLIHVADVLCMDIGWGLGSDGLQYRQDEAAARRVGIDNQTGERIVCDVLTGLEEMKDMFALNEEGVL